MIDLSSPHVQLVLVDSLFVVIALTILLWFRSWLRIQTRRMDRRFDTLDAYLKQLTQIQERLQGACRTLSAADHARSGGGGRSFLPSVEDSGSPTASIVAPGEGAVPSADGPSSPPPPHAAVANRGGARSGGDGGGRDSSASARQHEVYERARQLVGKGIPTEEVARLVDLGVAEVEVLKRMGALARSSSR